MTDTELKAIVTAIVAGAMLKADPYYLHPDGTYHPMKKWGERMDLLAENAGSIASRIIEQAAMI